MTNTEDDLIKALSSVMTLAESLIVQLGEIAKIYDKMPDDIKQKLAKTQIEIKLGHPL